MATPPSIKRLVLLSWILVAVFYFYLSYDYVRVSMNDRKFADYVQFVTQIAGTENRPAKEVRALILIKAQEFSLPIGEKKTEKKEMEKNFLIVWIKTSKMKTPSINPKFNGK